MPTTNINAAQANILRAIAGGKPGDPVPMYELVKPSVVKERCAEYGPNRPDVLFLARESCIGFQGSPSSVELTPRGVAALQQYESNPTPESAMKPAEPERPGALDYADFQLISRALIVAEVAREKTTDLFSRELARETGDADRAERLQRLLDGDAAELERIATLRAKLARIFCGK